MPDLSQVKIDEVAAACREGTGEIAEALGRLLDAPLTVAVGQPGPLTLATAPSDWTGPGLAIVFQVGRGGAIVVLPEQGGLVPAWCTTPDATGRSRLSTAAQELGMLLLPSQLTCDDFQAGRVENLSIAIRRGGLSPQATSLPLDLEAGDGRRGSARLIWPLMSPHTVLSAAPAAAAPPPAAAARAATAAPRPAPPVKDAPRRPTAAAPRAVSSSRDLPEYAQSLLRIHIPVVVTLARNRQPLWRIIELGPGSIIHFDKSCEEMLDLELEGHKIAAGEAVKVGDKFGLRITSIALPDERFKPVPPRNKQAS